MQKYTQKYTEIHTKTETYTYTASTQLTHLQCSFQILVQLSANDDDDDDDDNEDDGNQMKSVFLAKSAHTVKNFYFYFNIYILCQI